MADKRDKDPRVGLSIESATTGKEKVELDYRLLVTGDFSKSEPGSNPEDVGKRKTVVIKNKGDFKEAMKQIKPKLQLTVPNRLAKEGHLTVNLEFNSMEDMTPDRIIEKVPALQKLLEARRNIENMKKLTTDPKIRTIIEKSVVQSSDDGRDSLLSKLDTDKPVAEEPKK